MSTLNVTTQAVEVKQYLGHTVFPEQLLWIGQDGKGVFGSQKDAGQGAFPLWVRTESPKSKFFATTASNAGMLQRKAFPGATYHGLVKRVNSQEGVAWEAVDKIVHDGRGFEVTVKNMNGFNDPVLFVVDEAYLFVTPNGNVVDYRKMEVWEPSFGSSSQTRKAELVYKPTKMSFAEYFKRIGFDISAYEESIGEDLIQIAVDKMAKRVKQTASASRAVKFIEGYEYSHTSTRDFEFLGETVTAEIVHLINQYGKEIRFMIAEDFTVRLKEDIVLPHFKDEEIPVEMKNVSINKAVTDGSHFIDLETSIELGLKTKGSPAGVQFRFGPSIKGLGFFYPGLLGELGVHAVFFKGGIKGDAIVAFKEGLTDFAVLNNLREDTVAPSLKISRQVTTANQSSAMLEALTQDTKELIGSVMEFDHNQVREFLSIGDATNEEDDDEEVDVDQLTTRLYATGGDTFMKSHTMRKKLADLLKSSLERFGNGSALLLKEASFKHMLSDPYAVVQMMKQGVLGCTPAEIKSGINRGRVAHSELVVRDEFEVFQLNNRPVGLFRFPFLHKFEGRILNRQNNVYLDDASASWYESRAINGQIQGLIIFSLLDMNAEGMSGADYDGDQCVVTTNPAMVDNIPDYPLFLDYSLVDGELVSGCPFPGGTMELTKFLRPEDVEFMQLHGITSKGDKLIAPAYLSGTVEWVNLVGRLSAYLARHNVVTNDIGRFTNISMTIMHIENVLKNKAEEVKALESVDEALKSEALALIDSETEGLARLTFYLAMAIRWEVDKAKHGGAYMDHMPFLKLLEGAELEDVLSAEEQYGVSLQRLLFGDILA